MSQFLFDDFEGINPAAWKQKIQVDLKGADYNSTLLWKTNEGITVKPFYTKEDRKHQEVNVPKEDFKICQTIKVTDEKKANNFALKSIQNGATAIAFMIKERINYKIILSEIDVQKIHIYFSFSFLDASFIKEIENYTKSKNVFFQVDIIGNLAETGNWFFNLKEDYKHLEDIYKTAENALVISGDLYQNAGANIVQQLAYTLAHANEYLNHFNGQDFYKIHFKFALGSNYFHEIAKLRAFKILWSALLEQYNITENNTHIFATPSTRNKTIYDYNVNMLRTTSEVMSGVLGGANTIANSSYDFIYAESNEFGERISRNQLLILQQESGFKNAQYFAEGSYYLESLTQQFAEKALTIFKQIEKGGGFLAQLKEGIIQRKIKESATKEQEQFYKKELILLGTNYQPKENDYMHNNIQKDPFLKQRNIKTVIVPILRKRLAEKNESKRLKEETRF